MHIGHFIEIKSNLPQTK